MASIRVADFRDAAVPAELGRRTFHETFAADNTPEDMDAYMTGRLPSGGSPPRAGSRGRYSS